MADFRPKVWLNHRCPFCMKFMTFVREAGLWDRFDVVVFEPGTDEHAAVKAHLAPHFDSVSFPTVETAPGSFMKDSDALIAHYEGVAGVKADDMPLFQYYVTGLFLQAVELHRENMRLKEGAGAH